MKSDLSKVKVGDKIWTIQEGWTEVKKIDLNEKYSIVTKNDRYTINGLYLNVDQYPSAFLTNPFENQEPKEWEVIGGCNIWVKRNGFPINGKFYVESDWTEWREIEQPTTAELTLEQIADKFGISVEQLKIKK